MMLINIGLIRYSLLLNHCQILNGNSFNAGKIVQQNVGEK